MVHGHDLGLGCATGHGLLLLTGKRDGKAGVRASHEQDPHGGRPTGIIVRHKAGVSKRRQTQGFRAISAPSDQSKILMLVNVTHHAARAISVC
eukprot:4624906-Alexandrium_andersonii.AAC.1